MNLPRIKQLENLIAGLKKKVKEYQEVLNTFRNISPKAKQVQGQIDSAINSARNRVSGLGQFGFSPAFLESIFAPVQNAPNCSGLGSAVSNGINDVEEEVSTANNQISRYSNEKKQLESEVDSI